MTQIMTRQLHSIVFAAGLVCLAIGGCNRPSQDPQVLAIREQYVMTTEPEAAVTLTELAKRLQGTADEAVSETAGDDAGEPAAATEPSVAEASEAETRAAVAAVVIGRVYAGDLEPWDAGKASFLLAELPAEGHGDGHDADNCPFCKRRAAQAPTAIVQFLDERGKVIAHDARQLFDLQKNDVVTVRGRAVRGELNSLVVTADAIYVHPK
mgnify:CR=1 FL=1